MSTFILKRILHIIPVLILSSILVFLLLRLTPGDPALLIVGPDASEEVLEAVRQKMGLDKPLVIQYGIWLKGVLKGDLGVSHVSNVPVSELIKRRFPATAELALASIVIIALVSVPLGVAAALKPGETLDYIVSSINAVALAIPNFWLAILAILAFAVTLKWLPPGGRVDFPEDPLLHLKMLILPTLTLSFRQIGVQTRFVRSSMLDSLYQDYVRTAYSKGLGDRYIHFAHVLRNALIPIITALGIQVGRMFGGAVVIETVFAWPGLGRLMIDSINARDYGVVQGVFLVLVIIFSVVNLITDLIYGFLDPRVRLN